MRNFLKCIFDVLASMMDLLVCLAVRPERRANSKRVCFVFGTGIGDSLIWFDTCRAMVEFYRKQGFEAFLCCDDACADLYSSFFPKENIFLVQFKRLNQLKYRWRVFCDFRRAGYDVAINLSYSRSVRMESFFRVCAGETIGNAGDSGNMPEILRRWTARNYTRLAPPTDTISELKRNEAFARWLGLQDYIVALAQLPEAYTQRKQESPYFVVMPGASSLTRQWPTERFAVCCKEILRRTDWNLKICGGKGEEAAAARLEALLAEPERVENLAGKTSLQQYSAVIANSCLLLTNDTSAFHFAMAARTPTICLAKGCSSGRFVPYPEEVLDSYAAHVRVLCTEMSCQAGDEARCFGKGRLYPCLEQLTAEMVLKEIETVLERNPNHEKE